MKRSDVDVIIETLTEGVRKPHVYFCIGKGGVGKTTVSILLALLLSRKGRVLLASLDPAKHLLEYLSLEKTMKKVRIHDKIEAVQYDLESMTKKVTTEYTEILRQVLPGLRILNLEDIVNVIKHSPGFEEDIFLRIIMELYNQTYDYIVIDTPPTGITHRILSLPRVYEFWVNRLYDLRLKIVSLRYAIARAVGEKFEPRDPVLDKLEELRDKYTNLIRMFRDKSRTSSVIVVNPEPLPVYEAKVSLEILNRLGISTRLIVVNKVLPSEIATRLGVKELHDRSLKEALSLECGGCKKLLIPHHRKTPRSLNDVIELVNLLSTR